MLKEILKQNFIFIDGLLTESSKIAFLAELRAFDGNKNFYKSFFACFMYEPNVIFSAFILLKVFTIMLSVCRHYTLEPRFQT